MNPTFGSSLNEVIFEHSTDELPAIIESVIKEDVKLWLPILQILNVNVTTTAKERDTNKIIIQIKQVYWSLL